MADEEAAPKKKKNPTTKRPLRPAITGVAIGCFWAAGHVPVTLIDGAGEQFAAETLLVMTVAGGVVAIGMEFCVFCLRAGMRLVKPVTRRRPAS